MKFPLPIHRRHVFGFSAWATLAAIPCMAQTPALPNPVPADSLPAFRSDSSKSAAVKALESGAPNNPAPKPVNQAELDSLAFKLKHRRPFVGVTLAISFTDHSAKQRFSSELDSVAHRDSLRILQPYDPVHLYFPIGLVVSIPVFTYLDVWLRTEHFWYQMSSLAQGTGAAKEFSYSVQGQFAGLGARYLVPIGLLSVSGHPGLYVAYTQLWSFGNTEMYAPTGSVHAKFNPAGAGYEIQTGFQQDFSKRWTLTGGLAFSNLSFSSHSSWKAILPTTPDETANEPAKWTLRSLRLCFQGLYQFGNLPVPPKPITPAIPSSTNPGGTKNLNLHP